MNDQSKKLNKLNGLHRYISYERCVTRKSEPHLTHLTM
jgi:hypothetical protein